MSPYLTWLIPVVCDVQFRFQLKSGCPFSENPTSWWWLGASKDFFRMFSKQMRKIAKYIRLLYQDTIQASEIIFACWADTSEDEAAAAKIRPCALYFRHPCKRWSHQGHDYSVWKKSHKKIDARFADMYSFLCYRILLIPLLLPISIWEVGTCWERQSFEAWLEGVHHHLSNISKSHQIFCTFKNGFIFL